MPSEGLQIFLSAFVWCHATISSVPCFFYLPNTFFLIFTYTNALSILNCSYHLSTQSALPFLCFSVVFGKNSWSLSECVFVCVLCVWVVCALYIYMLYIYIFTCSVCICRHQIGGKYLPLSLSISAYWGNISHWTQSSPILLARQFALGMGVPISAFRMLGDSHLPALLSRGFWWSGPPF